MIDRQRFAKSLSALQALGRGDPFDALVSAYRQEDRYYHNLDHIADCLGNFDRVRDRSRRPAEVEVAIWFHDAVYDTHRGDNEEQSARWAAEYLTTEEVPTTVVARVADLINVTKSHQPTTIDQELLVDVDLAILGTPPDAFESYDAAIRKEYAWVPEADYRIGRIRVLQHFLEREAIYHTPQLRAEWENQARENLTRKIDELAGQ